MVLGLSHGAGARPPAAPAAAAAAAAALVDAFHQWRLAADVAHVAVGQHAVAALQVTPVYRALVLVAAQVLALHVAHGRPDAPGRRLRGLRLRLSRHLQGEGPAAVSPTH